MNPSRPHQPHHPILECDFMSPTILVIDDEASNRVTLERILKREGYDILHASSGREGLDLLRTHGIDVLLTDLKMPGMSGLDVLRASKKLDERVEVVVMTAFGTVETAVEAMKEGAYDFIVKPLKRLELVSCIKKALEKRTLSMENAFLRAQLTSYGQGDIISQSPSMRQLLSEIEQVAPSEATVLITGESGTGKGRLARLIHRMSSRNAKRLVTINCAAIPETLIESELFGYEKGAFTGATEQKMGRFDVALEGTLFLDEVTELKPGVQVRLLRVLQDGEYERVGGTDTLHSDVRVLAATNINIEEAVESGAFREDLFYRLNVIRLSVPPLRDRYEDISLLAHHFLDTYKEKNRKPLSGFTPEALEVLQAWNWPGNVRELENAVERAVVLCRGESISELDLPEALRDGKGKNNSIHFSIGTTLKTVERRMIEETLRSCKGDKTLAASLLGTTSRTLYRREADWIDGSELDAEEPSTTEESEDS